MEPKAFFFKINIDHMDFPTKESTEFVPPCSNYETVGTLIDLVNDLSAALFEVSKRLVQVEAYLALNINDGTFPRVEADSILTISKLNGKEKTP